MKLGTVVGVRVIAVLAVHQLDSKAVCVTKYMLPRR